MPELPEIETIKIQLKPTVTNKYLTSFFSSGKKLRRIMPDLQCVIGEKILNVYRRNKYLILEVVNYWIVIHLGMTGKLIIEKNKNIKKHTHFILSLSDDSFLSYEDARRFGALDLFSKKEYPKYENIPLFLKLGVEPLGEEFSLEILRELLKNSSLEIKKYLMDSNNICGVGNIYANEILFICNINPQKKSNLLSDNEIKLLYINTKAVLIKAISLGGSSISDFVHTNGQKGTMQENYFVYSRNGLPCKKCNTEILKITQGGRSSFYCPRCQPIVK